uniref:DUF3566 domain-containing protein n=1 Tax=candidate division CPR3 bacterium TaxID=2268181 RepID=A0A7C4RAQ2_UNCC3
MAKKTKIKKVSKVKKVGILDNCCDKESQSMGLMMGLVLSGIHLGWLILVLTNGAKPLMDWVLGLHMIEISYTINPFSFGNAFMLLVLTFVIGYAGGWLLSELIKISRGEK